MLGGRGARPRVERHKNRRLSPATPSPQGGSKRRPSWPSEVPADAETTVVARPAIGGFHSRTGNEFAVVAGVAATAAVFCLYSSSPRPEFRVGEPALVCCMARFAAVVTHWLSCISLSIRQMALLSRVPRLCCPRSSSAALRSMRAVPLQVSYLSAAVTAPGFLFGLRGRPRCQRWFVSAEVEVPEPTEGPVGCPPAVVLL